MGCSAGAGRGSPPSLTPPRPPPRPPPAIPAHLRAKGWSDARAFSATQLRKNPNSYFYRHVAPHEQQARARAGWGGRRGGGGSSITAVQAVHARLPPATHTNVAATSTLCTPCAPPPPTHPPPTVQAQGEWTPEEHELFLRTARAHGAGDKWGLFASHIPQRVGYQCSAYYRRVCACVCVWGGEKLGMCAWHAVWQGGARRVVARAWGVLRPLALVYTPLPPTLDTRAIPMHACREVIIPAGLVLDPRYRMTRGGKAVYASNA